MKRLIRSKNTYLILVSGLIVFLFTASFKKGEVKKSARSESVQSSKKNSLVDDLRIVPAADLMNAYLPYLQGKRIAVVANQTSVVGTGSLQDDISFTHLVDTLLSHHVQIQKVFAPEHGFRGDFDAGEKVVDDKDVKTGLDIISLHGKHRKPEPDKLEDVDLVLFDIQDIGVRFYTYISTLSLVMEACAEQDIPVIVLDRPNPNGHYIDGPMLEAEYSSFLGMHEIPLVYGMTIGEYAKMVNGESWLKDSVQCELRVMKSLNYTHQSRYHLPVRPSPNIPNDKAINLYPSLGFFEGTVINAGRGTEFQFQRYGAPFFPAGGLSYTPMPNFGSKFPKFNGKLCHGVDLSNEKWQKKVNLNWLIDAYRKTPKDIEFFGDTFTMHAGNELLRQQIEAGLSAEEIRKSWIPDLEEFKKVRKKYLLYP